MSYHITANYDEIVIDHVCDTYSLTLDDIIFYKKVAGEANTYQETGTVSFRNNRFIGLDIEKIEGVQ